MSVASGNAGEHLVMAELLARGFDAYWADRGNPAFDISCFWDETQRSSRLRVKTTSNHSAIWTMKKSGLFLKVQPKDDFVVIADIADGVRQSQIYIVPTLYLLECIQSDHAFYVSKPGRHGKPRKAEQGMRCIRFYGEDKHDNIGYAYDQKFAIYSDAWDQLK